MTASDTKHVPITRFFKPTAGSDKFIFLEPTPRFPQYWIAATPEPDTRSRLYFKVLKGRTPESRFQTQALEMIPRQHKKSKRASQAYHLRIQKKWNKHAAAGNAKFQEWVPKLMSMSHSLKDTLSNILGDTENAKSKA